MLTALVRMSLQFRIVVVLGAAVLMGIGILLVMHSPLDVFPEFAPPVVEVQTEAPGMSSEAVEHGVTVPLESALNGLPHMTALRSKSVQGVSAIQLWFELGTDVGKAQQMVSQRLAGSAGTLIDRARAPRILPPVSSTGAVLKIGLTPLPKEQLPSGTTPLTLEDLSVLVEWTVEPRLRAVPGVANISTFGLRKKQLQVLVKPDDLRDHQVTLEEVKKAAGNAAVNGSAGILDTANQRLAVQYATQVQRPSDLEGTVVTQREGGPVRLGQVARLKSGGPVSIGEALINGQPGLLMILEKSPEANTLQVTRDLEQAIETLRPSLPGVAIAAHLFRPATFIEHALANLRLAIVLGCLLVALILGAFLFEWRTAVISLTAIPLSVVTALVVLNRLGGSINTMVLAGLAIAIGEVVDDAIIDVENIVRRLRQNQLRTPPLPAGRVVLEASLEVRSAVVYASFIVVFVCLPILLMGGVAGSFFRPLALAYILAIMASLLVALTLTPAMSLMLLPQAVGHQSESPLARWVCAGYRRVLPLPLGWPFATMGGLLLMLIGVGVMLPRLKEAYLPEFQENDMIVHWTCKPGTGLEFMRHDLQTFDGELRAETPIREIGTQIGRAEMGEDVVGPNYAEVSLNLDGSPGTYPATRQQIQAVADRHWGFDSEVFTYLQERIQEVLSGARGAVVIRTYGPDLEVLRHKAQEIRQALEDGKGGQGTVAGVVDLRVEPQALVPQLDLAIDPNQAAAYGLTPGVIGDAVTTLINGTKVGEVRQDQRAFDLVVWGSPEIRKNPDDLRQLVIDLPEGKGTIPLGAVAEVRLVSAPNVVRHENASRSIDVTCNIAGRNLTDVVQEIQRRMQPLNQEGYRIELLGEFQARRENQRQLLGVLVLSLLGIALLLYLDFRSARLMALVLVTLPFAVIGGVAAAFATGGILSLGSLVGFVTVLGIAARNGIMLVSHYRHLQVEEGMAFGRDLVMRGSEERVAPILMTALAAGLGLLPLALSGNKPGYEVEYPMAVVILGGLFTSTILNLIVLPVLFLRYGKTVAAPKDQLF